MKKIPCLFKRDFNTKGRQTLIYNEVTEGCEWVLKGEGIPYIKIDGTACRIKEGVLYKRYDAKHGKIPPSNFEPCEETPDLITGHWPGWIPVGLEPDSIWHREAFEQSNCKNRDGTYELVGPKIKNNPEGLDRHTLLPHTSFKIIERIYLSYEGLCLYLRKNNVEGIVFHHPDGRMAKIRRSDYGFEWPIKDK